MENEATKKPFYKKPLVLIIAAILLIAFVAAIGSWILSEVKTAIKLAKYESFELIDCIDMNSVKTDGDITKFNVTLEDGTTIPFEGTGITILDDSIKFEPGGEIYSLDAIGAIAFYHPSVIENLNPENAIGGSGGYTFTDETSVSNRDDIIFMESHVVHAYHYEGDTSPLEMDPMYPNFVRFCNDIFSPDSFTLSDLIVYYDPDVTTTGIKELSLVPEYYGSYLEGELYNEVKEDAEIRVEGGTVPCFYLCLVPDNEGCTSEHANIGNIYCIRKFTIGDLKDAAGKVLNKATTVVSDNTTIEVTVGKYTLDVKLPVFKKFAGAKDLHELTPDALPKATGELKTLVVPVCWADQTHMATTENLDLYRSHIGRVADINGKERDYTDNSDSMFSLTEYFDIVSYGKLDISPVMTDWYYSDKNFAEMQAASPKREFASEILDWVKEKYPNINWKEFDKDADGYIDSMIIINAGEIEGDTYLKDSYSYGLNISSTYIDEFAGTQKDPTVNNFTSVGHSILEYSGSSLLIHEFSHSLGLIDYYDVTASGIDAVGSYDMMSSNAGDWNAYSKYSVGWIKPEIVSGLKRGESVEIEIGSLAETGDSIVIPAAGTKFDNSPFNEYIMIDLFTDAGANKYDAASFDIAGVQGVRIYHVNASMETHNPVDKNGVPQDCVIGTPRYVNSSLDSYQGKYHIELIQAGGKNTFTDTDPENNTVTAADFFQSGDTFTLDKYSDFFYNGKMDANIDFGYKIEIVNVSNSSATIRITAQ